MDNIKNRIQASGEWLKIHKKQLGLVGAGLIGIALSYGINIQVTDETTWVYNRLLELNNAIDANILGHYTLGMADYAINSVNNLVSLTKPDAKPLLKIAEFIPKAFTVGTLLAPVAAFSFGRVYDSVFTKRDRALRMDLGVEPLRANEEPAHVFIGSSEQISDAALEHVKKHPSVKNKPVIGIHTDPQIPPSFGEGQAMNYHFRLGRFTELVGIHGPTTNRSITAIEATGIGRAKEITFISYNPDNAIFYGATGQIGISPTDISTIIRAIPKDKIKGKTINVVMSKQVYLGGTTRLEKELDSLSRQLGFRLNIRITEDLVLDKIEDRLKKDRAGETTKKPFKVLLVGEGRELKDEQMLAYFKNTLRDMKIDGQDVVAHVITHDYLEGLALISGNPEEGSQRVEYLKLQLQSSDLVICYGDTDTGTSSLIRLILGLEEEPDKIARLKKRLLALVERPSMEFEYLLEEVPHECIYRLAIENKG